MLHQETFKFLRDLSANNQREWFDENRERYAAAKADVEAFADAVRVGLIPLMPRLEELRGKDLMYRIFVRWSKGRLPYKTHFSAYFHAAGRKSPLPGYYIRIAPGGSLLAAGLWDPEPVHLSAVQSEIDYANDEWLSIVENRSFRKTFKLGDERSASIPKGFAPDHPAASYLKLKSFVAKHPLPDDRLLQKDAAAHCVATLKKAAPFVSFLSRALDN